VLITNFLHSHSMLYKITADYEQKFNFSSWNHLAIAHFDLFLSYLNSVQEGSENHIRRTTYNKAARLQSSNSYILMILPYKINCFISYIS
jgi:hypothetical protein